MDKTKKYLAFSFVMVLVAVTIVSVIGMILLDRKPVVLQGQIEATEIRISGKLPDGSTVFWLRKESAWLRATRWW